MGLEIEQAGRIVQERAAEHQKLEEEHMARLELWLEERNALTNEIGRGVIERAQGYYDSLTIWNQQVQEFARQQDEVDLVSGHFDISVKNLSMAESAFEKFCMGDVSGDLNEAIWEQLVPLSDISSTHSEIPNDPKLLRAYRISVLADKVCTFQRQREAAVQQLEVKKREFMRARSRFEEEEALHRGCTWNCSVKRAQVYFEKRKLHEGIIDAQLHRLHAVEQELYAARHRVVELKVGAQRKTRSPSCRSAVSARYAQAQRFD